jgi:UDP-N-acetylmuramoyl-L-alanyl-D-glutamate--2,6-diaminopimelate ligase
MQRPHTNSSKPLLAVSSVVGAQCSGAAENIYVTGISQSSSAVIVGDLFIALPGEKFHGAQFAADAIEQGAVAVLTDVAGAAMVTGVPVLVVENPRRAAGVISAWFYEEPMRDLYSVGVTGTNGKTTVTTLLHQIMQAAGRAGRDARARAALPDGARARRVVGARARAVPRRGVRGAAARARVRDAH